MTPECFRTSLAACLLAVAAAAASGGGGLAGNTIDDFLDKAGAALNSETWSELETLSRGRLDEDGGSASARAFLAVALAGRGRFDESAAELAALREGGHRPDGNVPGVGNAMARIINIIYGTCWADFGAEHNRKAWSPIFGAFQDSASVAVPASRLLMAALKEKDAAETARLEAWFEGMLAQNRDNRSTVQHLSHLFARGYLRAEAGTPRALELATAAYQMAWEDSQAVNAAAADPLEKREKCDVACDSRYWDLALACALCKRFEPPENILAAREPEPGAVFEDATAGAGLANVRASRVAAADYDGDGYADLCFAGRLFRSEKGRTFREVTKDAGLTARGTGALFFDHDNDGVLDILVTAMPHPRLFRGTGRKGGFAFEDVTARSGLDAVALGAPPDGAAVADIDGDGWLDVFLAAYENPFPVGHPDFLMRNNGDGTFSDVSESSGIRAAPPRTGRGVTCADFDGDGDSDIYVSNYRLLANSLWQNDGAGNFIDIGPATGLQGTDLKGAFGHTIGSCWGDIDGDSDLDLFCANLAHPRYITQGFSNLSMLYVHTPQGGAESPMPFAFTDERRERGIRFQETHSDPAFADYDNDGDLDLSITATYVGAPSSLYQNDGMGFFEPVTFRSRSVVFNGWGQAWFDMDNDGDVDLVAGSPSGVKVLRNRGNANKWLKVKLLGKKKNLFGVGARVTVTTPQGLTLVREVRAGRGTQSQDGYVLLFGLGPEAREARVEVLWPSGNRSARATRADKLVVIKNTKDYPVR